MTEKFNRSKDDSDDDVPLISLAKKETKPAAKERKKNVDDDDDDDSKLFPLGILSLAILRDFSYQHELDRTVSKEDWKFCHIRYLSSCFV